MILCPLGPNRRKLLAMVNRMFRASTVRLACLAFLGLSLGTWPASGQQPDQRRPARDTPAQTESVGGSAQISGRVVAADTGAPVKRARIMATPREFRGRFTATTDERGSYEIAELPEGRYTVTASKAGFVTLSYGQRRPRQPSIPVQLQQGEALRRVDFNLPRGSVITGRVLDEDGEPLISAAVQVFQYVYRQGQRELVPRATDRTDDRGQYRVFGLEPGEYFVSVQVPRGVALGRGGLPGTLPLAAGRALGRGGLFGAGPPGVGGIELEQVESVGYAPTYYPGVTSLIDAVVVAVGVGQEAAGIDFSIQLVLTANVSGIVFGLDGTPAEGTQVTLVPDDGPSAARRGMLGVRVRNDGTFRISSVPPGQYTMRARSQARRGGRGRSPVFASEHITVAGQEVTDLVLVLSPGATISGALSFDTTSVAEPTDLTRIRVTTSSLRPDPFGGSANARVREDGSFELSNVPSGPRLLRASGVPAEWTLRAVYLNGSDVIDTPLDFGGVRNVEDVILVFTDRVSELSGLVLDEDGDIRTDLTVIAFPIDSALWLPLARQIRASRPDQNARYQIRGLPPGDYWLVTVDVVQDGEWYDPRFLQRVRSGAARVTIREGDVTSLNLTIGPRRF